MNGFDLQGNADPILIKPNTCSIRLLALIERAQP
jgi:hypothetical protein